jgi:hypothetical protein
VRRQERLDFCHKTVVIAASIAQRMLRAPPPEVQERMQRLPSNAPTSQCSRLISALPISSNSLALVTLQSRSTLRNLRGFDPQNRGQREGLQLRFAAAAANPVAVLDNASDTNSAPSSLLRF